jgi:hypothetical protein
LVEQDETRIGIEIENDEHCYADLGKIMLQYAGKFYKTKRQLKKRLKTGDYSIKEYSGDDLGDSFDVSVVRGSTIPTSRALRRQEIMNAYGQGLLGNPQDPAVQQSVLEMMEFGDTWEMWKKRSINIGQIQRTIEEIEKGIVPEVNELDNHALHIQEKNDFRMSDRGAQLPPEIKQLLLDDINRHLEAQMRLTNPALFQEKDQVEADLEAVPDDGLPIADEAAMPQNEIATPEGPINV